MIEVSVQSLAFDRKANSPVVILRESGSERILPIWIGPGEASAIAMQMGGISFQRPLTHDLLMSVLGGLGGTLQRVLITGVEESTYFAEMIIDRAGEMIAIDARPSDSIAVALRAEAQIFADEALLIAAAPGPAPADPEPDDGEGVRGAALEERLRRMHPEDLGRFES